MKLENDKLIKISGGAVTNYTSSTFISAVTRGINVILDVGRSIGSAINRIIYKKTC